MSCSCCNEGSTSDFNPFIKPDILLQRCPLDNGVRNFKLQPVESNDILQRLPLEVYHACLQYLDLGSLTTIRRLSQYTRSAVDYLPQYKDIYDYARPALRACLATNVAHHIPLLRLHRSLTSLECHYCKYYRTNGPEARFGSYLTLCGGRRTCLYCLRNLRNLKLVELSSLISLRYQPDCSLPPTKDLILLHTIPGSYACEKSSTAKSGSFSRQTLTPGFSVIPISGRTFTEKETKILRGSPHSTQIVHHPFVLESQESDISPTGFSPETGKEVTQRYLSVISFPYLSSSKTTLEHGVFCSKCCWKMAYDEHRWQKTQRRRRNVGQRPMASTNRRHNLNYARKLACRQYVVSEAAVEDAKKIGNEVITLEGHMLVHQHEGEIGEDERLFRTIQKEEAPIFGVPKHMFG